MFARQQALTTAGCCTVPKLSVSTATTATTATKTPQSAWGKPGPPTKPWSSVWTERRMSFSQPGKHGHTHLPPSPHPHTPISLQKLTRVCSAGTAGCRATGARGGSHLSSQSKQWSGPAALNPAQAVLPVPCFPSHTLTHRSVDVLSCSIFSPSCFVFTGLTFTFCSPSPISVPSSQREKLVLILVCAGAAVIVLVAVVSAVFAVRRTVYSLRWAGSTCKPRAERRAPQRWMQLTVVECRPLQDSRVSLLKPPASGGGEWGHGRSPQRHQQQQYNLPAGFRRCRRHSSLFQRDLIKTLILGDCLTFTDIPFDFSSYYRIFLNDTLQGL